MRQAVCTIQSSFRAHRYRQHFLRQRAVVCRLQANVRCRQARALFVRMQKSVCLLQSKWRAVVAGRQDRNAYLLVKRATMTLQCFARKVLAVRKLQSLREQAQEELCKSVREQIMARRIQRAFHVYMNGVVMQRRSQVCLLLFCVVLSYPHACLLVCPYFSL